ncbi:MAG: hypothetical protein ACHQRM_12570 [Bacteroidia bacterium]
MGRNNYYIQLSGFGSHQIKNASGKAFTFTELICEEPNSPGFALRIAILRPGQMKIKEVRPYLEFSLSTTRHILFSNRPTHFSFESHTPLLVPKECKCHFQLIPVLKIHEFSSVLRCELV